MIEKFKNLNMGKKILILYVFLILVVLFVFFTFLSIRMNRYLQTESKYSSDQAFLQTYNYVNEKINGIFNVSFYTTQDNRFIDIISKSRENYSVFEQFGDMNYLKNVLILFTENGYADDAACYVRSGTVYSNENDFIFNFDKLCEEQWYKDIAFDNHETFMSYRSSDSNMLSFINLLYGKNDYSVVDGALRVDISKNKIEQILKNGLLYEENISYITSPIGILAATCTSENDYPCSVKEGEIIILGNEKYRASIKKLEHIDWEIVTLTSLTAEGAFARQSIIWIFVLMTVILIVSAIIARFITVSVTKNITMLSEKMVNIKTGDFTKINIEHSQDEVGKLIESFNYMIDQINKQMYEKEQAAKMLKQTELNLLYAQINPHFLYNTFNMILCLADDNETDTIKKAIYSLSDFYRLSLRKGSDITKTADEVELVKAYVDIQNIRFNGKINLIIDISDEIKDFYIPKLSLQPLVENSISHGILNKDSQQGTIIIKGVKEGDTVILSVYDDGVGIPAGMLDKMIDCENDDAGFGLSSTHARFNIYFNQKNSMNIVSEQNRFTQVDIKIPYINLKGDIQNDKLNDC